MKPKHYSIFIGSFNLNDLWNNTLIRFHHRILLIGGILFLSVGLHGQNQLVEKTIKDANLAIEKDNFDEAIKILGQFETKYPGDISVERLYAQVLVWDQDYEKAVEIYERAINFHPENLDVRLEYASMLTDIGEYSTAREHLNFILQKSPDNGIVYFFLGKLLYYQGNFVQSYKQLKKAKSYYPNNQEINDLKNEVNKIIRPNISLIGLYRTDQQPLSKLGTKIKFDWFRSKILHLGLEGNIYGYSDIPSNNIISNFKLSNEFNFQKSSLKIKLAAGFLNSGLESINQFIGDLFVVKKFKKFLSIDVLASRKNYDYTSISAGNLLMTSDFKANLIIGRPNSFNGVLGSQYTIFPDQNSVYSIYLWVLSKPIEFSGFKLVFGYSVSHMNSKEDKFEPDYNLEDVSNYIPEEISGFYIPYYTPMDLWSNSVLIKLQYIANDHFSINTHFSLCVYSTISVPYFYLDISESNELYIVKDYIKQQYLPMDIGAEIRSKVSNKLELNLSYNYLSTYYFISHYVDLGLKIIF